MRRLQPALARTVSIIIGVILVVAAAVGGIYVLSGPLSISFGVASSTSVGTAGQPISFSILPSSGATVASVTWNFGDGNTSTTSGSATSHTYANGGSYLVWAQVTATYQHLLLSHSTTLTNDQELFPIDVQSNLTQAQAAIASVPTINFPVSKNPNPAIFTTGQTAYPAGGFLQSPSNSSWSIQNYIWNYGNGQNSGTILPNSTTLLPSSNVTVSYSSPGLYPLALKLTTNSSSSTFTVTTVHTVPVGTSASPYAILTGPSGVVNPNVITAVEVVPGGPYSFDPQLDYDVVGEEELFNVFQTLVYYNGSSSASFIPYLATVLPTVQNGGISPDYRTYTFQIRSDQYFSNGDKVTAYDVWYSFARGIAFANGSPGTPDWIQDQFLIPGVQNGSATVYGNNTWSAASTSVTYDNSSNTVTFHLNRPVTSALFFQVIADPEGGGIIDHNYAESVGAGFDEATFGSYQSQANSGSYDSKMQWSPVGSGPYMVESLTPGQSVELVPNPKYPGVQGIPKANTTVVIDWVKTPDTAFLMLQDGQADSVYGLPPADFPVVEQLLSKGLVHIYNFPTITIDFYGFNININKQLEANQFGGGGQFNEPYNYFADLPTRLAWVNAYDYQGFLNNILGNAKYGTSFGSGYAGPPPPGVVYSSPPSQLGGLPAQNLNDATGNFSISAWHDRQITIPIFVTSGDPTDLAAAEEWASNLKQISGGNINAIPVPIATSLKGGYLSPGLDPMGVYLYGWAPDYPYPSDTMDGMFKVGGYYPNGNNWLSTSPTFLPNTFAYNTTGGFAPNTPGDIVNVANTGSSGPVSQDVAYAWINGNVTMADSSTDPATIQRGYKTATILAIDMGLYVYTEEEESFWYWRSWLHGSQYQENPLLGAFGDLVYVWLSK